MGKNLCAVLRRREDVVELYVYDLDKKQAELNVASQQVNFVIHLAGVNRPEDPKEFKTGNAGSLKEICSTASRRPLKLVYYEACLHERNGLTQR